MGIFYATLLGLFVLTRLFIHVKTVQVLPVAISEKSALGVALNLVARRNSQQFAANIANEGNL
jgi:hypothetical protein